jgi:hypothetical protein
MSDDNLFDEGCAIECLRAGEPFDRGHNMFRPTKRHDRIRSGRARPTARALGWLLHHETNAASITRLNKTGAY